MEKIDSSFDPILNCNYDLCKSTLNDFKVLAKSWYDIDFNDFDNRIKWYSIDENSIIETKKSGLLCNYLFAYKEDNRFYLIDGFNRLFTTYAELEENPIVYIKVITDKLEDHQLMHIMFKLNMWKIYGTVKTSEYSISNFFDRGFKLFLHSKFNIKFNDRKGPYESDIRMLDYYFRRERESVDYFKFGLSDVSKLFSNKQIVNDIRQITAVNQYDEPLFRNFDSFFKGFIMYLSRKRVSGDTEEYNFEYFLNHLYEDKKFYKKLVGMSGNDSTRKNIYKFYEKF